MLSSATSPVDRIFARESLGVRRLEMITDSPSGTRAMKSRMKRRTSCASSTEWKSSKMMAIRLPSSSVGNSSTSPARTCSRVATLGSSVSRTETTAPPNDGLRWRSAATRWWANAAQSRSSSSKSKPRGLDACRSCPVREDGRLAVAGLGGDQDDAVVDLRVEPVQQAIAAKDPLGERRALDLRQLDREARHCAAALRRRDPSAKRGLGGDVRLDPGTGGRTTGRSRADRADANDTDVPASVSTSASIGAGRRRAIGGNPAAGRSPADYLRAPGMWTTGGRVGG